MKVSIQMHRQRGGCEDERSHVSRWHLKFTYRPAEVVRVTCSLLNLTYLASFTGFKITRTGSTRLRRDLVTRSRFSLLERSEILRWSGARSICRGTLGFRLQSD